jgi:hypothetical protein
MKKTLKLSGEGRAAFRYTLDRIFPVLQKTSFLQETASGKTKNVSESINVGGHYFPARTMLQQKLKATFPQMTFFSNLSHVPRLVLKIIELF